MAVDRPVGATRPDLLHKRGKGHVGRYNPIDKPDGSLVLLYDEHPTCPVKECEEELRLVKIVVDTVPYVHTDITMMCPNCEDYYIFGIPKSKVASLALHVFDTNPMGCVAVFYSLGDRKCPWHKVDMIKTKVFGDWLPFEEYVEFQWKCPVCHLTHHEMTKRNFPHGKDIFTEKEREEFMEKLRRWGYV